MDGRDLSNFKIAFALELKKMSLPEADFAPGGRFLISPRFAVGTTSVGIKESLCPRPTTDANSADGEQG
jgi:hypothetical protein